MWRMTVFSGAAGRGGSTGKMTGKMLWESFVFSSFAVAFGGMLNYINFQCHQNFAE